MPNKIKAKTNPNSLLKSKIIAAESKSFPRHFIFCNAIFVGNCRFKKSEPTGLFAIQFTHSEIIFIQRLDFSTISASGSAHWNRVKMYSIGSSAPLSIFRTILFRKVLDYFVWKFRQ